MGKRCSHIASTSGGCRERRRVESENTPFKEWRRPCFAVALREVAFLLALRQSGRRPLESLRRHHWLQHFADVAQRSALAQAFSLLRRVRLRRLVEWWNAQQQPRDSETADRDARPGQRVFWKV